MAIHSCKICGTKFYTPTSGKYCSNECYCEGYREQRKRYYENHVKPKLKKYVTIEKLCYSKEEIKSKIYPLNSK